MRSRTTLAVVAGKLARTTSRRTGRGGTALPGLVAERLDPQVVSHLAAQLDQVVLVTGTNGKTTTARMLARILSADGRRVVHNRAGSNLMRGIAATLIESADLTGHLPPQRVGVFEVDEATLPAAAVALRPRLLLLGNLHRDQLDRYGEVETVRARWLRTLEQLPPEAVVALNADDPLVASLAGAVRGRVLLFGIDDPLPSVADHAADALWDPATGADYVYDRIFYAHIGHWRCADGSAARPAPQVRATQIDRADPERIAFDLHTPAGTTRVLLPLVGLYNVYNALAAATAAQALGVALTTTAQALSEPAAAFGRQERLLVNGHPVRILLGKNPAGLTEALRTLQRPGARHHLLVLLNDGIADGTDVSWIWDTEWEALAPFVQSLVVGGTRARDMALRLAYAGLPAPAPPVHHAIGAALAQALEALPVGEELVVLPTYTAMLDVRARLARLAGAQPIWEGA